MPLVTRWFVKTALLYMAATFIAGAVMLIAEAAGYPVPSIYAVEHAHADRGRYPEGPAWLSYAALNSGLLLRLLVEPWFTAAPGMVPAALLMLSAVLQLVAVLIFLAIAWLRVIGAPAVPDRAIAAGQPSTRSPVDTPSR